MANSDSYPFVPIDAENILKNLVASYQSFLGSTVHPGSPARLYLQWLASVIQIERGLINFTGNQNLASRAWGPNLDALGANVYAGISRAQARAATCRIRFSITAPQNFPVLIPAGTRVSDPGSTLIWSTNEDLFIPIGDSFAETPATCSAPGSAGNGYLPGQISKLIDPFDYAASALNVDESAGGSDPQTDAEFYDAMRLALARASTAGSRSSYLYYMKQADGNILDAAAVSHTPGEVTLYAIMQDGSPAGEQVKARILEACNSDETRPLTDKLLVGDPEIIPYSISLTYFTDRDTPAAAVADAVHAAVNEYVVWQRSKLGRDINPDELRKRILAAGAKRIELESPSFIPLVDGLQGDPPPAPQVAALQDEPEIINGGAEDE